MKKRDSTPLKFEQAMQELDGIVAQMEKGELPLDEMVETYKRGAELISQCRSHLNQAKSQIQQLEKNELQPFEYESDS